jgi:glycosyltransferase involved in cell wall biosynthesis
MAHLLADPAVRARLAQQGLRTVRQRFALSDYMAKLDAVWTAATAPGAGTAATAPDAGTGARLRVLFYNQAAEISGAERVLLDIMALAQHAGHSVALAAPPGPLGAEAERTGIPHLPVIPLVLGYTHDPRVLALYAAQAAAPIADLARVVRGGRPHVVYANSIRAGLIAAVVQKLVRPHPRLVVHVHDALHTNALNRLAAGLISSEAAAIVAISQYVTRGLGRGKVQVLHNAIDPQRYCRAAERGQAMRQHLGVPPQAPLLAVVGQLTPWKGQMDALDAFARLRASCPAAHLVIAGAAKFVGRHRRYDTTAYRAALLARAQQPDLRGHVHFLGDVADVVAVYSAATLLVVPSWSEPFGRVVIEAMAAQCPVLATRAGGIPEIVTHGVDGWLVPPRDSAALAAAMAHLLADPAVRARLAQQGLRTVRQRFALSDYMAKIEEVWTTALRPAERL